MISLKKIKILLIISAVVFCIFFWLHLISFEALLGLIIALVGIYVAFWIYYKTILGFSDEGKKIIHEVSSEIITDETERLKWNSFNLKLLNCIKSTFLGQTIDFECLKKFSIPENDKLLSFSVKIFLNCCNKINDPSNNDYILCNKLSQIYLIMRKEIKRSNNTISNEIK